MAMPLSGREAQVMTLLSRGLSRKEIAFELGLSDSTVRVYIHRAARKHIRVIFRGGRPAVKGEFVYRRQRPRPYLARSR